MICWLAGWPHCGSTLARNFLKDVFGLLSVSMYYEPKLASLFGPEAEIYGASWGLPLYAESRDAGRRVIIKTHDFPFDASPCIYVVRDGRDACASLAKFWKMSVARAIRGENPFMFTGRRNFGTWAAHYASWHPLSRPNTILVKFSDFINCPDGTANRLSAFLEQKQTGRFEDKFEELKKSKIYPELFDDQNAELRDTIPEHALEMFWRINGQVMKELGYIDEIPPTGDSKCKTGNPYSLVDSSPSTPTT